jgi:uncharacterized integral membrane protein (TIGR00698 family)
MTEQHQQTLCKVGFVCLFLLTSCPLVGSPLALFAGFSFAILFGNPLSELTAKVSNSLLKASVVGLGFGVNFVEVIEIGKNSLLLTLLSISATLLLGRLIGQLLQVPDNTRALISFGTAICGGSAIVALAPVVKAEDEEIAVSLATVFALNALALILFPPLGELFGLSQQQFGLWAALAIHDTSSVVGASTAFGSVALTVATIAKLTRALWIVPCSFVAGLHYRSGKRVGVPPFIIGFVVAAFLNSWLPSMCVVWDSVYIVSKQILIMTLFLIGAGLTRQTLQQAGLKPLILGFSLWCCISIVTLVFLLQGYIG